MAGSVSIKPGEVVSFPTETFFALGCDPRDRAGVDLLIELKSRPEEAGLPLIIADAGWIEQFIASETEPLRKVRLHLQQQFWPGPLTIVFPVNAAGQQTIRPEVFGPGSSLAVRVSPDPVAREIARAAGGAVISTSANPRGLPPRKSAAEVSRYFPSIQVIGGECGGAAKPSTIIDLRTLPPKILREGEIPGSLILSAVEQIK